VRGVWYDIYKSRENSRPVHSLYSFALSRIGGGVCVLVSKHFHLISVDLSEFYLELEIRCFDLMYFNVKCRLFAVYRAPKLGSIGRILQYLY